jgi:hypothetical protein
VKEWSGAMSMIADFQRLMQYADEPLMAEPETLRPMAARF